VTPTASPTSTASVTPSKLVVGASRDPTPSVSVSPLPPESQSPQSTTSSADSQSSSAGGDSSSGGGAGSASPQPFPTLQLNVHGERAASGGVPPAVIGGVVAGVAVAGVGVAVGYRYWRARQAAVAGKSKGKGKSKHSEPRSRRRSSVRVASSPTDSSKRPSQSRKSGGGSKASGAESRRGDRREAETSPRRAAGAKRDDVGEARTKEDTRGRRKDAAVTPAQKRGRSSKPGSAAVPDAQSKHGSHGRRDAKRSSSREPAAAKARHCRCSIACDCDGVPATCRSVAVCCGCDCRFFVWCSDRSLAERQRSQRGSSVYVPATNHSYAHSRFVHDSCVQ
jgi:hypothetical protein